MNNEPSLEQIEDYNNNESAQKRKTVKLVVIFCLLVGAILAYLKYDNQEINEYIGTPQKPGINTTKQF